MYLDLYYVMVCSRHCGGMKNRENIKSTGLLFGIYTVKRLQNVHCNLNFNILWNKIYYAGYSIALTDLRIRTRHNLYKD